MNEENLCDCIMCTNEDCAVVDSEGNRTCSLCGAKFVFEDIVIE